MSTLYNPNHIVIGVVLLFLIGYTFFVVRRMYKRRIDSLENKVQELQQIIISNKTETRQDAGVMGTPLDEDTRNLLAPLFNNSEAFVVSSSSTMPGFVTQHKLQEPLEIIDEDEDDSSVESASLSADVCDAQPVETTMGVYPVENSEELLRSTEHLDEAAECGLGDEAGDAEAADDEAAFDGLGDDVITPVENLEEVTTDDSGHSVPVHETATATTQKNEDVITDSIVNKKLELKQINSMNVADLRKHLENYGIVYPKSMKKPALRKMLISSST